MESKQRNIIRKAEKAGVQVAAYTGTAAVQHLSDFQRLRVITQARAISNNAKASMLLKSDSFFTNILLNYSSTLYFASINNEVAACALMLHSGKTTYYYSGGSDIELNKQTGASAFLIFQAITDSLLHGQSVFDMGGVPVKPSKEHPAYGVYKFKSSYGGNYTEYNGGRFIINTLKYRISKTILNNRKIIRILSKSM